MDLLVVLNAWKINPFKSIENPECVIEIGIKIPWFKTRGSSTYCLGVSQLRSGLRNKIVPKIKHDISGSQGSIRKLMHPW